jgi:hypothetical protein
MIEPVEEPPWLIAQIDQRIADIKTEMLDAAASADAPFVMTFLNEPDPGATAEEQDRWERSCDHCGRYCPEDGPVDFYTGHAVRTVEDRQVLIAFGICDVCKNNPKGTEDE